MDRGAVHVSEREIVEQVTDGAETGLLQDGGGLWADALDTLYA